MFAGCSSGVEGNVWKGAIARTYHKCIGRGRQHEIGGVQAQCYGLVMFQLTIPGVVAGNEVMTGQASLRSPEHTVTIPLTDYTFTDTVAARGLNCGGGSATSRADGRFVIYLGLYGNRGDNPHAPLPVPRDHGAPVGNTNAAGKHKKGAGAPVGNKYAAGKKLKKRKGCIYCGKSGNKHAGSLNADQLHQKCVAKFEMKQKTKKDNGGFVAPIFELDALRKRKRDEDYDNDTDSGGGGGGGGSSRLHMGALVA